MRNLYIITNLPNKRKVKNYINREMKKQDRDVRHKSVYFYYTYRKIFIIKARNKTIEKYIRKTLLQTISNYRRSLLFSYKNNN